MKKGAPGLAFGIVIAILGIAAGVLRYFELTQGLERGMVGGSPLIPATRVAVVAGVLIALAGGYILRARKGSYAALYGEGVPKAVMVAAGFVFIAAAAAGIAIHGAGNMMRLILSAFSAFCGGTLIFSVASEKQGAHEATENPNAPKTNFVFTVFPVFFFGFLLVSLYVFHANNAVLEKFGYTVIAGVAAVTTASHISGVAFGEAKAKRTLALSAATLFLSLMVTVGEVLNSGDMQVAAIFGATAVWSFGSVYALSVGEDVVEKEKRSETEGTAETGEEEK